MSKRKRYDFEEEDDDDVVNFERDDEEENTTIQSSQSVIYLSDSSDSEVEEQQSPLRQQTVGNLKVLFKEYLRENYTTLTSGSTKRFLSTFAPELNNCFAKLKSGVVAEIQEERQRLIQKEVKSFKKVRKLENNAKPSSEFFSDPALLVHILSFLDIDSLFLVGQSCEYFRKFLKNNVMKLELTWIWMTHSNFEYLSKEKLSVFVPEVQYKKACIILREKYAFKFIADASVEFGQCLDKSIKFFDLFQNTVDRLSRLAWIRISSIGHIKKGKYSISSNHLHSKFMLFGTFGTDTNSLLYLYPRLPVAKKVVLFVQLNSTTKSLQEKISVLNNIQLGANVPIEVFYLQQSSDTDEQCDVTLLNENMILYIFKPKSTTVLHKGRIVELQRSGSRNQFRYKSNGMVYFKKVTMDGRFDNSTVNSFKRLFKKQSYTTTNHEEEEYVKRIAEVRKAMK